MEIHRSIRARIRLRTIVIRVYTFCGASEPLTYTEVIDELQERAYQIHCGLPVSLNVTSGKQLKELSLCSFVPSLLRCLLIIYVNIQWTHDTFFPDQLGYMFRPFIRAIFRPYHNLWAEIINNCKY